MMKMLTFEQKKKDTCVKLARNIEWELGRLKLMIEYPKYIF